MSGSSENGYAGDISVVEAYEKLSQDPGAVLIDVRTEPEWRYVGVADLAALNKSVLFLSWQVYPAMNVAPDFAEQLTAELRRLGVGAEATLLFLCRSGQRSRGSAAAATAAGWAQSYNITDGFEGPLDSSRHRGGVGGWKANGLPWTQT